MKYFLLFIFSLIMASSSFAVTCKQEAKEILAAAYFRDRTELTKEDLIYIIKVNAPTPEEKKIAVRVVNFVWKHPKTTGHELVEMFMNQCDNPRTVSRSRRKV